MKKVILALSGGVDSMVLIDCLYKKGFDIVAAHVNYNKRNDSYKDLQVIHNYLKNKDIILETLNIDKDMYTNDNFQAQARKIRYDFFNNLAIKYNTDILYVAHHKDDFLETYIFQQRRKGLYNYNGIAIISFNNKMKIIRPLLNMYKDEIIQYAKVNNIVYHEDYTNKSLEYTRNQIRADLDDLTIKYKDYIYLKAMKENEILIKEYLFLQKNQKHYYTMLEFNSWSKDIQRRWLFQQIKRYDISLKYIDEIIRVLQTSSKVEFKFLDTFIIKTYDTIYTLFKFDLSCSYYINNLESLKTIKNQFKYCYNFDIMIDNVDYPYYIKILKKEDYFIIIKDYKKHKKRIKNKKIPSFLQNQLPIVEKDGKFIKWAFKY